MTTKTAGVPSATRSWPVESTSPQRLVRVWALGVVKYGFLIALSITFVLPFYWMVVSALKDNAQVFTVPPVWIPNPAHWENFRAAWTRYDFNTYLINTVFRYALPVSLFATISSAFVAYGFSRIRWRGRDVFFFICLATMMVPFQVRMVPLFIIFKQLGWINSYLPLIVPAMFGVPYFIFMLRQFFLGLPQEISDAARIDGASEFGIFARIILPLSKPALTVVVLFQFLWAWNDYLGPLVYLNRPEYFTLALGIEYLRRSLTQVTTEFPFPYLMAVSAIVTAPILIAFFFAQRTFVEGISLTGIKG